MSLDLFNGFALVVKVIARSTVSDDVKRQVQRQVQSVHSLFEMLFIHSKGQRRKNTFS